MKIERCVRMRLLEQVVGVRWWTKMKAKKREVQIRRKDILAKGTVSEKHWKHRN